MSQTTGDQNEQVTNAIRPSDGSNEPSSAQDSAKPPSSERKVRANRENAKRSTGPRTERGQAAIRNNAHRHGLYSNDAVIREGPGQENEDEFQALLKGFLRSWEPSNQVEEREVRSLAETEWRLQRLVRAEVGEIRRQTELDWKMLSNRQSKEISSVGSKVTLLTQVRDDVEEDGYVSDALQKELDRFFGKDDSLVADCREISQAAQKAQLEQAQSDLASDPALNPDLKQPHDAVHDGDLGPEVAQGKHENAEDPTVADCKHDLLFLIEIRISILKHELETLRTEELRSREASLLAYKLPSGEFLDRLIRYETALEKKKEAIIKRLLRLKGKKT